MSTVKITDVSNESVKSVFCFTVAPEYKRKGVATLLLRRICEDAKRDYFDYVEAYPNKEFIDEFQDYMGPYELYRKLGFFVYQDAGNMLVVRKKLKP